MKTCRSCLVEKPLKDFHKRSKSSDGHQSRCKSCNTSQRVEYYKSSDAKEKKKQTQKKYIESVQDKLFEYLREHPCVDCGESDIIVLQFDHTNRDSKSSAIASMINNRSWETIQLEIKKCQVRCANCHTRVTAKQFGWRKSLMLSL